MPTTTTRVAEPFPADSPFAAIVRTRHWCHCPRCGSQLSPNAILVALDTLWCANCGQTARNTLAAIKAALYTAELAPHRSYACGVTAFTPRHPAVRGLPAIHALIAIRNEYKQTDAARHSEAQET